MKKPLDAGGFLDSYVPRKAARATKNVPNEFATAFFTEPDNPYFPFRLRDKKDFTLKKLRDYLTDFATHIHGISDLLTFHLIGESQVVREQIGITDWKADNVARTVRILKVDIEPYMDNLTRHAPYLNDLLIDRYRFDFDNAQQTLTLLINELKALDQGNAVKWRIISGAPNFLRELTTIYDTLNTFYTNMEAETGNLANLEPFKDSLLNIANRLQRGVGKNAALGINAASAKDYWSGVVSTGAEPISVARL